jgi:predicted ATP-dependent endonuclease of OLD family
MKLLKVKFENFRIIKEMDWIPIKKLMILTGENDGGKTSTLNALEIFLNPKGVPDKSDFMKVDNVGNTEEKISMYGIFSLDSNERALLDTQKSIIEVKREFGEGIENCFQFKTKVCSNPLLQGDWSSKPIQQLKEIANELHINLTNKNKKDQIIADIKKWIRTQTLVDGLSPLPKGILERLPMVKIFASSNASNLMNEITDTLKASFQDKLKTEKYSGKLQKITGKIESDMKKELSTFKKLLLKYCPDISHVDITPQFDFTRGFTTTQFSLTKKKDEKNEGLQIDLEKEGEGRKRKITLAIYEWRKLLLSKTSSLSDQTIIGFDEPDTHQDYSSQRKIFDIIRDISKSGNNYVIVCTHSLNLIDRIPMTDIVLYEVKNNITTVNMIASEDPELEEAFVYQIGDNIGLRNSAILYERCFLIVEGNTEISSLPILFQLKYGHSLLSAGITLLNGQGSSGANILAKYLVVKKKNVIFMIDQDTKLSTVSKYFTSNSLKENGVDIDNQVFFIGKNEFEDSFSDKIYLATAKKFWKRTDGKQWKIKDFSDLRKGNFSKDLVTLVQTLTGQRVRKQDIGRDVARTLKKGDIPTTILQCFNKAYQLANTE